MGKESVFVVLRGSVVQYLFPLLLLSILLQSYSFSSVMNSMHSVAHLHCSLMNNTAKSCPCPELCLPLKIFAISSKAMSNAPRRPHSAAN